MAGRVGRTPGYSASVIPGHPRSAESPARSAPAARGRARPAARSLVLRFATVGLLALATTRATVPVGARRSLPALAVIDVSDSIRGANDALVAVSDGGEERLLVADGVRLAGLGETRAPLGTARSRLAHGLRAAADVVAPGAEVWLVTDGWSTEPGVAAAARALRREGHRVHVAPPPVLLADVGLVFARVVGSGPGGVTVAARVASGVAGHVRVSLRRAGQVVAAAEVAVAPGSEEDLVLADARPVVEPVAYEVLLEAIDGTPDDDPHDDRLVVLARPATPLVVVLDDGAWPAPSADASCRADVVDGARDPALLGGADALLLAGRRAGALRDEGAARVGALVASGAVLVVLGGPASYGPGGWRGSALERLLPLRSSAPEGGETALVICLDRSGSTGEVPVGGLASLPVLVRATQALADAAPADVRIAVLPFADRPDAAPLAPGWLRGGDPLGREALRRAAAALTAGGGTDLDAAIAAAADLATRVAARRRRVLVVTDGDPDRALAASSFPRARAALARGAVELGAVVHRDAVAAAALRALAAREDDVAVVDDAAALPAALLAAFHRGAARDEVVSARFEVFPMEGEGADALAPLAPRALHRLEASADATLLAAAAAPGEAPRPFAAMRRYGAGRVIALAWGPAFEVDPDAARRALLPFVCQVAAGADRGLVGTVRGDRLVVEAEPGLGALRVGPTLAVEDGAAARAGVGEGTGTVADLVEVSPGVYEGVLEGALLRGLLEVSPLAALGADGARRPIRLPSRPPPEARGIGIDRDALAAWAEAGGGRLLPAGRRPAPQRSAWTWPLAPLAALLALGCFVADRASRRPGTRSAKAAGIVFGLLGTVATFLSLGACATNPRSAASARGTGAGAPTAPEPDRPLAEGSPEVRARVAEAIETLGGDDPDGVSQALSVLRGSGEPAVAGLVAALRDASPRVRARAAFALGALGDRRAVEPLAALAAADADATVRCDAGASLLDLNDPRGFAPLVDALEDDDPRRRVRAIDALAAATGGARLGYAFDGPADERTDAVARWRAFLARRAAAETAIGVPVAPAGTGQPTR